MKKVLTLALALVLALSLAVPALAFWGNAPSTAVASGATVDIYLVDHDGSGSILAGLISMPATDRGYAKNEIVAAVASLMVPANVNLANAGGAGDLGYRQLRLSGTNVSVNVTDNDTTTNGLVNTFPAGVLAVANQNLNVNDNRIELNLAAAPLLAPTANATYRVLYFAKVTGDDATMSITLTKNLTIGAAANGTLRLGTDYIVTRTAAAGAAPHVYTIAEVTAAGAAGNQLFIVRTDANNRADSISVTAQSLAAATEWFGVTYAGGEFHYVVNSSTVVTNIGRLPTDAEKMVLDSRMNSIFSTALGLDITKRNYSMADADWNAYANSLVDITESVDIEPWTPYVVVPDNIIVDPPKTGDAASILGFIMIALAGAAVVAVKKVRA